MNFTDSGIDEGTAELYWIAGNDAAENLGILALYRLKIDINYATNRNCVLEFGVKQ